ncbi:alpha/beta fold hydrolase [Actinosynnema sp. NPDC023794]
MDRSPRATLYCFPHAGGAAGEYARWAAHLPDLRVAAINLPGRAHHLGEQAHTAMAPLVEAVVREVAFSEPFALFGHSLGALVAFEVARKLRARGSAPLRLFVSSCTAPPLPAPRAPLHVLDDRALRAEIERRWGPLPASVGADDRLLAAALACYRADFTVLETYRHVPGEPVDSPITALVGDREVDGAERMTGWREHTAGPFDLHRRRGGHFHTRDHLDGLCRLLTDAVTTDLIRTDRRTST